MTGHERTASPEEPAVSGFLVAHADDDCPEYDIVMTFNQPNRVLNSVPGTLAHLEDGFVDDADLADGARFSHDLSAFARDRVSVMAVPANLLLEKCLAKSLDELGAPYAIARVSEWLGNAVVIDGGLPMDGLWPDMASAAAMHDDAMSRIGEDAMGSPSIHVLAARMSPELQNLLFDIRYKRIEDGNYAACSAACERLVAAEERVISEMGRADD